ncbi:MAG: tetratricopeptide repeat protein [Hyphomicrobiaceae bacterium]
MRNIKSMTAAAMLTVVLASIAPVGAQTEIASSSDCLNISVNTEHAPQLDAVISICTRVLGRKDLSPEMRADLLVHRGVAYRNVGDHHKSLADLSAARDLAPNDPRVSRMLAWTYREMDRPAEAEKEYDRALKLEPHPLGVPVSLFRAVRHEEVRGRASGLRDSTRCRPEREQHIPDGAALSHVGTTVLRTAAARGRDRHGHRIWPHIRIAGRDIRIERPTG